MPDRTKYAATRDWLEATVDKLRQGGARVYVPADQDGTLRFSAEGRLSELPEGYLNTRVPLKEVFFPQTEVIFEYETENGGGVDLHTPDADTPRTVVIGVRPCDAAGLAVMDTVFQWDYEDTFYCARRRESTIVTFACSSPDDYCFCTTVGISPGGEDGSDVLVSELGDGRLLVESLTEKGEQLMADAAPGAEAAAEIERPAPPEMAPKFDVEKVKPWLDENFESDFWLDVSLKCLGCGACSYLCPTCHCFDIVDEADWKRGERRRNWDCCSFAQFTRHASGHNPRPTQTSRCRQRLMHKFKYFSERFDRRACVGCGRCARVCGAGQNVVSVLQEISEK